MRTQVRKINENVKLQFRQIGNGFIIAKAEDGVPFGRKLAKTFHDQFNRKYVQINGDLELVTERHCYLGVD
jgi:hypothetical protein